MDVDGLYRLSELGHIIFTSALHPGSPGSRELRAATLNCQNGKWQSPRTVPRVLLLPKRPSRLYSPQDPSSTRPPETCNVISIHPLADSELWGALKPCQLHNEPFFALTAPRAGIACREKQCISCTRHWSHE
jgi:hypothetical protein